MMDEFVDSFKALSDNTRIRIIWILNKINFKLCVCEIMDALNESHYKVSRHLAVLKNAGFLNKEKKGRWMYYDLVSPKNRFQELLHQVISALPEELFHLDWDRLQKRLATRKNGKCVVGMKTERHQIPPSRQKKNRELF